MRFANSLACAVIGVAWSATGLAQVVRPMDRIPPVGSRVAAAAPTTKPAGFIAVTAAEVAEALAEARERAGLMMRNQPGKAVEEIETEHFLIFTDWPKVDQEMMRRTLENAYARIAPVFEVSPRENVFVGKLPVYMFARKDDFVRFASAADQHNAQNLGGYYHSSQKTGRGHLVSFAPDKAPNGATLERWGYVLTHEMAHAFVHRYRTNLRIPKWLNEGLAEVVATEVFPRQNQTYQAVARKVAFDTQSFIGMLKADRGFMEAQYYPVCQSMVRMLMLKDRRSLMPLLASIKEGTEPEEALRRHYGMGYKEFAGAWRQWVVRH